MTTIINADNGVVSGSAGLKTSADSSGVLELQTNGTTALTVNTLQNATFNSTGSLTIPVGTTAQRPSSPVNGMVRFNTTLGYNEWYSSIVGWLPISQPPSYSADVLIVAGGGGRVSMRNAIAGTANTGGGGGGGYAVSGAAGGSGICIVRYLGSQRGSGGTITFSNGYTYHTFTASGTFIA